jgi:hypothetical protein
VDLRTQRGGCGRGVSAPTQRRSEKSLQQQQAVFIDARGGQWDDKSSDTGSVVLSKESCLVSSQRSSSEFASSEHRGGQDGGSDVMHAHTWIIMQAVVDPYVLEAAARPGREVRVTATYYPVSSATSAKGRTKEVLLRRIHVKALNSIYVDGGCDNSGRDLVHAASGDYTKGDRGSAIPTARSCCAGSTQCAPVDQS